MNTGCQSMFDVQRHLAQVEGPTSMPELLHRAAEELECNGLAGNAAGSETRCQLPGGDYGPDEHAALHAPVDIPLHLLVEKRLSPVGRYCLCHTYLTEEMAQHVEACCSDGLHP